MYTESVPVWSDRDASESSSLKQGQSRENGCGSPTGGTGLWVNSDEQIAPRDHYNSLPITF